MKLEELSDHLTQRGLTVQSHQIEQLKQYYQLLCEWNEKMNLTSITAWEDVLDRHIYDSLYPFFDVEKTGIFCDVGAGAGFPSIPVKIFWPQWKMILVEPTAKRVRFLEEVIRSLHLENIECKAIRAEDLAHIEREQYDLVTARAVAPLPILAELCIPLVKPNGLFVAMKGASGNTEHQQAQPALKQLGCMLERSEHGILSDGSERINLFYRKVHTTPKKYPRPYAQIKNNPLHEVKK